MHCRVRLEVTFTIKLFATVFTVVYFVSIVNNHVCFKTEVGHKCFLAHGAGDVLGGEVNGHVFFQSISKTEWFVAYNTHV